MLYNIDMEQNVFTIAIVGGGASGLFLATALSPDHGGIALFERGERVGRKLSATGNGQGNITNAAAADAEYFSSTATAERVGTLLRAFPPQALRSHMEDRGILLIEDERGRVYPAGRQASALTDALRFSAARSGVRLYTDTQITHLKKQGGLFVLCAETPEGQKEYRAQKVVLCTGGKAAKNFGTDGTAYALAQGFGHTLTPLFPSLVQLKTDTAHIKTLKGIRVMDARLTAKWRENGRPRAHTLKGDVIFTEYGVSGDAVFRISAYIADKLSTDVTLEIDLLPDFAEERIFTALTEKRKNCPELPTGELLGGMVNNQIGRAVMKRAGGDLRAAARTVKGFSLAVCGSLGFDYAQVTKGGIPLNEVDENLQSKRVDGLYFAGETLDVDGQCGGFNLQWAYSSACTVARALEAEMGKDGGHV